MSTPQTLMSARKRLALNLSRLLVLGSAVSALVLANPGAASASTSSFAHWVNYDAGTLPRDVAVGDFNADSDPDVAVVSESGDVSVVLGGAGGTFGAPTDYPVGISPQSIEIGDFNGDGDPDLVVPNGDDDNVSVLLGGPGGTFGATTNFAAGVLFPDSVAVGDFNDDGDPDLAVTSEHSSKIGILSGGPGGTFGTPTIMPTAGGYPSLVVVSDFNADGDPDLAFGVVGGVAVLLGGPGASFGPQADYPAGITNGVLTSIAVGDFNADSDPDLVIVDEDYDLSSSNVRVFTGDSGGTFAAPVTYPLAHGYAVAVADFNDDSDPDLAVGDGRGDVLILHGGDGASFGTPKAFKSGGAARSVAVGDFNADSLPDLVAGDYESYDNAPLGGIGVLLNTLDTTPPDTTITAGPSGPTNASTPRFVFTSSEDGSTFECRVDSGAFTACTAPRTTALLSDGTHTFEVRATDPSGNLDPTPASRTFTVDTVEPDTTITGGPDGQTNDNTPTFTFTSSEDGVTFQCRIDAGPYQPCTSPYTSGGLGDGDHTFSVVAIDVVGRADPTPATRSFTLDRNPPTTTITSGPSGPTGDSTPTFGFTSPDSDVTYECRVDDAAFEACSNPHTTAELDDGEHIFQVRAVDSIGNVDPIPAAAAFTVDTVAPDTTIRSGPTGLISDNTPTFGWEYADGAATHECRVDSQPFAPCESPKTTDRLSDGQHTFELRAIDVAGNTDPTPAKRTFIVDTEALVTGITSGPSGLINDSTPTFSFSTSEPDSTFECKVSGGFEPCSSPYTSPALSDGEHTFQVRSTDSVGNVESPPVSRTFTVDTNAPDTTINSGPTGTIDDQTPTFGFSSPDAEATLECRVDGAAFAPCASPYTTALLANGSHTFEARATDAAGNTDPSPASRTFTVNVDTTAPTTHIDSGPANLTNKVKPTFTFSANEPATFECKLDAGSYAPCESGDEFGPLGDGSHAFAVRATDLAGNVDPTPATRDWIVDTTPPQTTITSGPSGLSLSSIATFVFTSSEGGSTFQCRLDGGAWQACTSPRTYTGVYLGNHSFSVRAIDPAGNTDPTPAEGTWLTLGLLPF
jgi:hypothetical protein